MGSARTDSLAGTTIATAIRGDDPFLRPGRARRVRAVVTHGAGQSAARELHTFHVTFHAAATWDVERISARLRVQEIRGPYEPAY